MRPIKFHNWWRTEQLSNSFLIFFLSVYGGRSKFLNEKQSEQLSNSFFLLVSYQFLCKYKSDGSVVCFIVRRPPLIVLVYLVH